MDLPKDQLYDHLFNEVTTPVEHGVASTPPRPTQGLRREESSPPQSMIAEDTSPGASGLEKVDLRQEFLVTQLGIQPQQGPTKPEKRPKNKLVRRVQDIYQGLNMQSEASKAEEQQSYRACIPAPLKLKSKGNGNTGVPAGASPIHSYATPQDAYSVPVDNLLEELIVYTNRGQQDWADDIDKLRLEKAEKAKNERTSHPASASSAGVRVVETTSAKPSTSTSESRARSRSTAPLETSSFRSNSQTPGPQSFASAQRALSVSSRHRPGSRHGPSPSLPPSRPLPPLPSAPPSPALRHSYLAIKYRKLIELQGQLWFTSEKNGIITRFAEERPGLCKKHQKDEKQGFCTKCDHYSYEYHELRSLDCHLTMADRQIIIANNRSLRNIKNELEGLLERRAIDDEVYEHLMSALPVEQSFNGQRHVSSPANVPANNAPPPAYTNPTPPSLPGRQEFRPEIARATALYKYNEQNDCTFEKGDTIVIYEYMNADWWMGRNLRTNKEGVLPVSYVQLEKVASHQPNTAQGVYNEKDNGYQASPGPSNPYNSSVPPMAVAEQPSESGKPSKGGEMGKKFGKKLGNAAIFGAGATIGGNIVNSIF